MRGMHQLPPVKWVARVVVTDTPEPGRDYLPKDEIEANILNNGGYDEGVYMVVDSLERMHGYNPAGELKI